MVTIDGLTEQQIIKVIESIINQLAPKYTFGYYTLEDIKQEGFIIAIAALSKFNPKKGVASKKRNSLSDRLYNFLRTHIAYRYRTLVRDNFERSELPNCNCKFCKTDKRSECKRYQKFINRNAAKKAIASAAYEKVEHIAKEEYNSEIYGLLNEKLPIELRQDFKRLLDGVKIPNSRKDKIKEILIEVLRSQDEL